MKLLPKYLRSTSVGHAQRDKLIACLEAVGLDHPTNRTDFIDCIIELIREAYPDETYAEPGNPAFAPPTDKEGLDSACVVKQAITACKALLARNVDPCDTGHGLLAPETAVAIQTLIEFVEGT